MSAVWLIILFTFLGRSDQSAVYGNEIRNEIRVGLKSFYTDKKELTVDCESMLLGFCNGQNYLTELELKGVGALTVTPETRKFLRGTGRFSTKKATEVAEMLKMQGLDAVCVLYAPGASGVLIFCENEENTGKLKTVFETAQNFGVSLAEKPEYATMLLRMDGGTVCIYADGSEGFFPQLAADAPDEQGRMTLSLGKRCYRGRIEIGRYGGSNLVSAVNVIPIEEYLCGVVPCEMPASWPIEALKAQAVCARSFAMTKAGFHSMTDPERGYQIMDTELSQVYGGATYEKESSSYAVNATRGETLCYNNRTVSGYYCSASGGHTEDVQDVWNFTLPYLNGVPDLYETNSGQKVWRVEMTKEELRLLLLRNGKNVGAIRSVEPVETTESGRVTKLKIVGSDGSTELTTASMRSLLGFSSTKFSVIKSGDIPDAVTVQGAQGQRRTTIHECSVLSAGGVSGADNGLSQYVVLSADNLTNFARKAPDADSYLFAGLGFGHGVGMSQAGARGMAEHGFSYQEILKTYFTGISVR